MMSRTNRVFVLVSVLGVFLSAVYFAFDRHATAGALENRIADSDKTVRSFPASLSESDIKRDFGNLPLYFTVDRKTSPEDVKYYSVGNRYGLSLTRRGAALQLVTENLAADGTDDSGQFEKARNFTADQVNLRFVGADFSELPTGEAELAGKVNYLVGNDASRWQTNSPTFAKVRYKSVYPGIDALFYGNQRKLEYDFIIAPRANPKLIALEFDGLEKIVINQQGDLVLKLKNGDIVQRKPVAYQTVNGARQTVKVKFIKKGKNKIAFRLGKYDSERELIIDPVIIFSTYWGGSSTENATAVRTDTQGNIYLTGATVSANFPTVNPLQPQIGSVSSFDAFVTKINSSGNSVIYSTYLGGNSEDYATSLSIDANGNTLVAGRTFSTNFPTVNAQQTQLGGSADGFVAKLNSGGSALIFSTYLGGAGFEEVLAAKLDPTGRPVLAGRTDSSDFPTVGAFQTNLSGTSLFRSGNSGSSWTGGSLAAGVNSISSFSVGNPSNIVFAATNKGVYRSTDGGTNWLAVGQADLPGQVSKIVAARTNSNVVYAIANGAIFKSTNGGDNWTNIQGTIFTSLITLAVDPMNADRVFAGGFSGAIFRTTDGGANWTDISIMNVFNSVNSLIIDPANLQNVYAGTSQRIYKSTGGGGGWAAVMNGITVLQSFSDLLIDSVTNTIYAAGQNGLYKSTDAAANWTLVNVNNLLAVRSLAQDPFNSANFFAATGSGSFFRSLDGGLSWNQVSNGLNPNTLSAVAASSNAVLLGGYTGTDAFVARLANAGSALDYSTFFGGNLNDSAASVEIGTDNLIVFAGTTNSPNFPVSNAIQANNGGGNDAFVTKLNANGISLVYSTFLGGSSNDTATALSVGSDGSVYITGSTVSLNFPVVNAFQLNCASCAASLNDAYVAKLNSTGNSLVYSSFLGGSSTDNGLTIRVDSQNRVFVGGSTASANFPVLDPIQTTIAGGTDGFVSQIKADGSGFIYSTFYGGSGTDSVTGLVIAPEGNAVIAGQTTSANFPVASPIRATIGGGTDAFLAKIGTAADLRITISDERDPVMVNNPLYLNLQITNNGPLPATGVVVTENLPAAVNFVSATPTQGTCSLNGSTLTCNLGNLALNSQVGIRLNLTPAQTGTISNTASVSGNEPDPATANNTATEQTVISALPSIFGKVTSGNSQPAGDVGINLEGLQNRTVQTGSNGVYGFNELPLGGNYTVRPVKTGFYFAPRSKSFSSLTSDGTADFVMSVCTYTLSADSAALPTAGGNRSIFVTTNDPFCTWTATSNAAWISITSGASGIGNGTVKITVQPSSVQRAGTLTIAGKTYTVTQTGCTFTLTPFQQSFGQSGGNGTLEVKTNESFCQWTAAANNPWLTINGNPGGTGNGIVNYTVAPTIQPRGGRITIGGQNFAVYQESNYCPLPNLAAPLETIATTDSNDIVAGDFNNDSFPDLATVDTTNSQTGTYSTYLSTGTGTFNRNTIPTNIGTLTSIVAADFNQDSTIDLALHGAGKISIYTNNGTAGFTLLGSFDAPGGTYSELYKEDLNRDGKMDLIVGVSDRMQVFTGTGNGTFTAGFIQLLTGRFTYSFAFGDLNGDGVTDAVVGQEQDFNIPRLVYFFGNPNGTFSQGGTVSLNLTPFSVKLADLNGDGRADLITNGVGASQVQVFLWNPTTNGFNPPTRVFSEPFNAYVFEVADMDNDGKPDIVAASNQGGNRINIMRGNGNGTFRLSLSFTSSTYINAIAFSDLNRDGKLDLAFAKKNNQMSTQLAQCGSSVAVRAPVSTRFDFDGDKKADFAVVRPSNNSWYVYKGANQPWIWQPFGQTGDNFVPADYDGDGRTDFAVFRPEEGLWYRLNSADSSLSIFNWGKSGDLPVAADFDGDERADLAVYRPGENIWFWMSSLNGQIHTVRFGLTGDVPVTGDYDGDGRADIAVFRPDNGVWYWLKSSTGEFQSYKYGLAKDKAVPGDYDGDGRTDLAVFRPTEGIWYIMKSSLNQSVMVNFGKDGDVPVAADYDGDGNTDIAVFRNGLWYLIKSLTAEVVTVQFGTTDDKPVPAMHIP